MTSRPAVAATGTVRLFVQDNRISRMGQKDLIGERRDGGMSGVRARYGDLANLCDLGQPAPTASVLPTGT